MLPSPRLRSPWLFLIAIAALLIGVGWFAFDPISPPPSSKNIVGATIFPLADIIRNIAGDSFEVVQLIPSNASPHSYEFTPKDVGRLQNARALFVIGHGLDDWSAGPLATSANVPIVVVDSNINLHAFGEQHEGEEKMHEAVSLDPHYFLTIPNAKVIATNVATALSELHPESSTMFQENLATYHSKLDQAETGLQQQAAGASQKHFIAMHDAWSYFSDQYGFELVDTYEPVEGREPSVVDLRHIQQLVEQYGITTFYAEPQKSSSSATRFLQKEFGLNIKVLVPDGSVSGVDSYIELMQYNMDQLTNP